MTLEELAHWNDVRAAACRMEAGNTVDPDGIKTWLDRSYRHEASAEACREAIIRRADPETKGYESASTRAAAAETDAALAKCGGGA